MNGAQLRTPAINGAVGGAVGLGAGFAGGILRSGAAGLAKTDFGKVVTGGTNPLPGSRPVLPAVGRATTNLAWAAGYGAVAGMAEGAAQDAVFGLSGDWVSGGANGGFNGAWGARHSAMNPSNKLSISPADHLEGRLHRFLDGSVRSPSVVPGGAEGDAPPMNDAPTPQRWYMPPDGTEGSEVWQDVSPPIDNAASPSPPPADANPWGEANNDFTHEPPTSGHRPAAVEVSPWTDQAVNTIPTSHPPSIPTDWIDPWTDQAVNTIPTSHPPSMPTDWIDPWTQD